MSPETTGFLLVTGAGLSTGIGSAFVFSPRLIKMASRKFLAGSLGFSAGVMLYVSFVEIFVKSQLAFTDELPNDPGMAYLYATLSFFAGIACMAGIDKLVDFVDPSHGKALAGKEKVDEPGERSEGCCEVASVDVDNWVRRAEIEIRELGGEESGCLTHRGVTSPPSADVEMAPTNIPKKLAASDGSTVGDAKLVRMGLATALSIAIHNFPEGLATYVAAINDPAVGATLAIAIAIHNIPEGLCVSIPIYYATGDRKKAFLWGILSGCTEPIGAIMGYIILAQTMSNIVYGLMFGLVAGMMVRISLKELLPTAYRYDPEDTVITKSVCGGMLLMASSLVLFQVV